MEQDNVFGDVISRYSSEQAVDDGFLVPLNRRDMVTRSVWEFFHKHTPMGAKPPDRWPVEMMGWFRAGSIKKDDALKLIIKHGVDAQKEYEQQIRDKKTAALAGGIVGTHGQQARRAYDTHNYALWAVVTDGILSGLSETAVPAGEKLLLLPNENGGLTLMMPEDN